MRIIFLISFFLLWGNIFSQSKIAVKSKVTENSVQLRWTPTNITLFKQAMQNGFTIQRKEFTGQNDASIWNSGVEIEKKLSVVPSSDTLWKLYFKKYEETGLVYSFIYPDKNRTKSEEENLFGLTLLSFDLNPDLAKISGLYFKDSTIESGRKYIYKISITGSTTFETILVNTQEKSVYERVVEWGIKKSDLTSEIFWNFKMYQSFYAGYFIERSEDSLNFISLTQLPLVPMSSQYEKNKEINYYNDTGLIENKMYWYRISGQDHFGDRGPDSKLIRIKASAFFKGEIIIDTLFESADHEATLRWHLSDKSDENRITSIKILRSSEINGVYELVSDAAKNKSEEKLKLTHRENFIKIEIWNEGIKTESWPEMILMPDRFPPAVPDSLVGVSDKNGKVTLRWKNNTESDLKGFRIFRSNSLNEEFVEVSKDFVLKNEFTDSISLNTLTEEVFYKVNAVDKSFNNSNPSEPVKIIRPDIIPPVGSPILKLEANPKGNFIQWAKSSSKDIVNIEIQRSEDGKVFSTIFSLSKADSLSQITDSNQVFEKGFYYRTNTIDDAKNNTYSETVYLKNNSGKIKTNDAVKITVDRTLKIIHLDWEPLKEEVYSYTVYKAKKGEILRSYKTVEPVITEITDKELYISNKYVYCIKAILKNGREVMIKENILVEY